MLLLLLLFQAAYADHSGVVLRADEFNFEVEDNPNTFVRTINHLQVEGDLLYIMEWRDPRVLVLDKSGGFVARIGKTAKEKGEGVMRMKSKGRFGVFGDLVLIGVKEDVYAYRNFEYQYQFKVPGYNPFNTIQPARESMPLSPEHLVVPAYPNKNHLALIYDLNGKRKQTIPVVLEDEDELKKNPGLNDTYWLYDRDKREWWAVFKFQPLIMHYNQAFEPIGSIMVTGPHINEMNQALASFVRVEKSKVPQPYFYDAVLRKGKIYLMTGGVSESTGVLYAVDLKSGETTGRARLQLFNAAGEPTRRFMMRKLAIFEDGTFLVSHGQIMVPEMDSFLAKGKLPEGF